MPVLTREAILQAKDIKTEKVSVPEWGGVIYVKGLTGAERDQFEASIIEFRGQTQVTKLTNVRARLAALSICDQAGKRLFDEQDVKALGEKSASALQKVFEAAQRLSGLSNTAVAELTKEFDEVPLGSLPSD